LLSLLVLQNKISSSSLDPFAEYVMIWWWSNLWIIWAKMEHHLHQRKIHDIDELREQLTATWHKAGTVNYWLGNWSVAQVANSLRPKGRHFEYKL